MKQVLSWLKRTDRVIWLEYAALSLVVMLPLLRAGYIFSLDMVFAPHLRMPTEVGNSYLFYALLHWLNFVLPSQVIQKIILLAIPILSGVGTHRLVQYVTQQHEGNNHKPQWGAYFAGIFYIFNPFVYSRFMAGHYLVLLGYALLPFFTLALFKFLEVFKNSPTLNPKPSTLNPFFRLLGWALLISIFSIHAIGFIMLLSLVTTVVWGWQNRRIKGYLKRLITNGALAAVAFLAASSYWLVPFATGQTPTAHLVQAFDQRHVDFFKTVADPTFGLPFNVAALYGYWGESHARYILPKQIMPVWPVLTLLLLALEIMGVSFGWNKSKAATITLTSVGLLAFMIAIGEAFTPFKGFYQWLYQHLPFFRGYREPQKFSAILALAYAVLGGLGVQSILASKKFLKTSFALTLALLLPILYTPTMLWGFAGQLKPVDYPSDWYTLNQQLNRDTDGFKILFLPWHQYLSFPFEKRVIANPAQGFFDKPLIQGDNAEFGTIFKEVANPITEQIENEVLRPGNQISDGGGRLNRIQIKYVILAKTADWQSYGFLSLQTDLVQISDSKTLRVYQNKAYRAAQ